MLQTSAGVEPATSWSPVGRRIQLSRCKSALNPPVVYSTDRSKAVVPVLVLLFVALWLYPRHTKYVGVYSFRFSVRPFVRPFVRAFVRLSVTGSKFLR